MRQDGSILYRCPKCGSSEKIEHDAFTRMQCMLCKTLGLIDEFIVEKPVEKG